MAQVKVKNKEQSAVYAALKSTWLAFCASSSIHGLKYTQDRETNKIVRFIWLLITLIMFICAISMVYTFYMSYRSNPTRMNVEKDHAPIDSLIFPAVTICTETLYNIQKAKSYIGTLKLPTDTNTSMIMEVLPTYFGFISDDYTYATEDIVLLQNLIDVNNISTLTFMQNLQWNCSDIFFRCRFMWRIVDCSEIIEVSRTYYGYCCSFNLNQPGLNYTAKTTHAGLFDGLSLILYYNDSDYGELGLYSDGFKVLLSENEGYPSAHSVIKFTPLKQETFLGVRPLETYCSRAVKALSIDERQCVLPDEFPLKHFEKYVGNNCMLECRVETTLRMCGCITYFFYTNHTHERICAIKDIPCLLANFTALVGRYRKDQCYCPNSCESIQYNVELTSAELQIDIPTVDEFYAGVQDNHSVIHIYLNSQVYLRVRRDLLSSMVTLVSNLGSAFSLFVGISMVSIVEVIYYVTVVFRKYYLQELKAREKLRR
ncbi:sodium channel protein Nach [Bactrocera neohumeralis]|uniref:sodium channel protein Nach n=1 Tax=Bactrocera neohumeralis TaxID=98809 RepID=UPI0021667F70|nr:sodium channel protein Nach [Bactrocera neohumeralis]